jgi:hypothetical protein
MTSFKIKGKGHDDSVVAEPVGLFARTSSSDAVALRGRVSDAGVWAEVVKPAAVRRSTAGMACGLLLFLIV